jgi:hypothetical protein
MKFEIVELSELSGSKATIYSIFVDDDNKTLFENFMIENLREFPDEINSKVETLNQISTKFGARRHFFEENKGKLGDLVCALYDSPNSNLRLYCIRFGTSVILLGCGGYEPKSMRALQESEKLKTENYLLREVSELIFRKMKKKEIYWINVCELGGDLILDNDD